MLVGPTQEDGDIVEVVGSAAVTVRHTVLLVLGLFSVLLLFGLVLLRRSMFFLLGLLSWNLCDGKKDREEHDGRSTGVEMHLSNPRLGSYQPCA